MSQDLVSWVNGGLMAFFRMFREQPTSEFARSAWLALRSAVSPDERLQQLFHPWTSYVIVPLFALANAGISIDPGFLSRALGSSVTLGIVLGYVVGKPASDLMSYAGQLGLDVDRLAKDLSLHAGTGRVSADVDSADLSGVSGTPTFFINGHRHLGAYDIDSLWRSVRAARARAAIAP